MEYLDGHTLKEVIKSEGPMKLDRVVEIVRQIAGALDAAHEQGVVHRDLKSDNVMLSKQTGGEWAKVLDFGIAKIQQSNAIDDDITAANLVIGTPQYMSPEQCSHSSAIDARSDIYSFGIIVYEMLAGQPPFVGESPTVIMMKQVQDPPPSVLEARPDLPVAVSSVISKALAKQPADRFESAGELSKALTEAASAAESPQLIAAPVTVPNIPVAPFDDDEATLVRPREVEPLPLSTDVSPPSSHGMQWWTSVHEGGRSQPGNVHVPSRMVIARRIAVGHWLVWRPTSRTSPFAPSVTR